MPASRIALDDAATRRLAQREFTAPMLVEAGAGTGKTALLVARTAAWCIGAGWERHTEAEGGRQEIALRVVDGVAAITFTDAAAAEMATRIAEALSGLARGEKPVGWHIGDEIEGLPDGELERRAAALCGEIHRLSVTTIHSFCQRVLAAHPFEAGIHPSFQIDPDGAVLELLVHEVVEEALRGLDASPRGALWERLAVCGVGPAKVADALLLLAQSGATPTDLGSDPFDDRAAVTAAGELLRDLDAFFRIEEGGLLELPKSQKAHQVSVALADARAAARLLEPPFAFRSLVEACSVIGDDHVKRLAEWSRARFTKGEGGVFDEGSAEIAEISGRLAGCLKTFAGLDLGGFAAGRELLGALFEEVQRLRHRRGIMTYEDLLTGTARLFTGHPEVCRTLRRRMDQLLVDEFQDTDTTQCTIVRALALDGPVDERPGLFVVGDPKQSIYAWRSADLAAYDGFVRDLVESGGVRGPLTRNFRSVLPILDEVERVVEPVMRREEGLQPVFESLEATEWRATSPGFDHVPWTAVEHWVAWPGDEDGVPAPPGRGGQDAIFELEARAIATDIRRLHDEAGVAFGDIAVLLRATTKQDLILEAFRELGVPFDVARERSYYERREIIEAAALTRAIFEPADLLALLTVIRSDAVGVPDAVLAPLWDASFPAAAALVDAADAATVAALQEVVAKAGAAVRAAPGSASVEDWPVALVAAMENLAVLRRSAREDPPELFVERLRTLWLAEVSAAARYLGRFRQARLEAFYVELEKILTTSTSGGADVARLLRRAVAGGDEAPTVSEPDRDADAVHMMTIYGAKGLDFEHVYLAQTHKVTGSFGRPSLDFRRWGDIPAYALFGWQTPGYRFAEDRRLRQERAERVRLLYVGMTRAKQRLVVSGSWSTPGTLIQPDDATTLADLVAHRDGGARIDSLIDRRMDREADRDPGVSWFLPALADPSWWAVGAAASTDALGRDEAREGAGIAEIAEARGRAKQRMARSWSVAASDGAHRAHRRLETDIDGEAATIGAAPSKGVAAVVGTAVHRLLETLDPSADLEAQIRGRHEAIAASVAAELDRASAREAEERLGEILDHLCAGRILDRFAGLAPVIIARELPVFLRPDEDNGTSVISGAVDLVFRDPEDGRLVIADFKTDRVESDAEIAERVERYQPQLETYALAVEKALGLEERPHTELWFISADRIVRLSE